MDWRTNIGRKRYQIKLYNYFYKNYIITFIKLYNYLYYKISTLVYYNKEMNVGRLLRGRKILIFGFRNFTGCSVMY